VSALTFFTGKGAQPNTAMAALLDALILIIMAIQLPLVRGQRRRTEAQRPTTPDPKAIGLAPGEPRPQPGASPSCPTAA
jgi:hypothetical protein